MKLSANLYLEDAVIKKGDFSIVIYWRFVKMNIKETKNIFSCLFSIVMLFALCGQVIAAAEPRRPRLHIIRPQRPAMSTLPVAAAVPMQCAASALPEVVAPTTAPRSKVATRQQKSKKHKTQMGAAGNCDERVSTVSKQSRAQKLQRAKKRRIQNILRNGFNLLCERSKTTDRQTAKSRHGFPSHLFEGIVRRENERIVIIDDPSNRQCLKIYKTQQGQDTKSARRLRYSQNVRDWFYRPAKALEESYRSQCARYGVKPLDNIRIDTDSAINRKSYAMHRFSRLVDLYLSHGKRIKEEGGKLRIEVRGAVSDLQQTEWRPCIFEYVFEEKRSHAIFHRNMKILSNEETVIELAGDDSFPDGLCLDDI